MRKNNFEYIEAKHKQLIDVAVKYMEKIETDYAHNINHVIDVVNLTKNILKNSNIKADAEVCIISAYWHDVGRIKCDCGHEMESCNLLKLEMQKLNYKTRFINKCVNAIKFHGWEMQPETKEGKIVKDADCLAILGEKRWEVCLKNNFKINKIANLVSDVKDKLYFKYSKTLYEEQLIKILFLLYSYMLK